MFSHTDTPMTISEQIKNLTFRMKSNKTTADHLFKLAILHKTQAEKAENEIIKIQQEETKRLRPETFLKDLEEQANNFWIEYNHKAGKPGYELTIHCR